MQVKTITLAHEWGHNFGSDHDTPLTPGQAATYEGSCTPGSDGEPGGNYLMCVVACFTTGWLLHAGGRSTRAAPHRLLHADRSTRAAPRVGVRRSFFKY